MNYLYKLIYTLSILLLSTGVATSQNDPSWYILDGSRAIGTVTVSPTPLSTSSLFKIDGVKPKSLCCNPNSEDDLLFIFDDGTYYNSRYHNGNQPRNWNFSGNSLDINPDKAIQYLIWTNRYDEDPPPPDLENVTTSPTSNPVTANGDQIAEDLTANRSVSPNRDITLILDVSNRKTKSYTIKSHIFGIGSISDYFELSPVFNSEGVYPSIVDVDEFTDSLVISIQDYVPTIFINLRAKDGVGAYATPTFSNSMTFEVYEQSDNESNLYASLDEVIGNGHDPNELVALRKCGNNSEGISYVSYTGQFYNTGSGTASDIVMRLHIPFIDNCISNEGAIAFSEVQCLMDINFWNGDTDIPLGDIDLKRTGDTLLFHFDNISLPPCLLDNATYEGLEHGIQFAFKLLYNQDNNTDINSLNSYKLGGVVYFGSSGLELEYKEFFAVGDLQADVLNQTSEGKQLLDEMESSCNVKESLPPVVDEECLLSSWCSLACWICWLIAFALALFLILIIIWFIRRN